MKFIKTAAITLSAGALVITALPAFAETSFYGSAKLSTFWNTNENNTKHDTNTDYDQHIQSNSVIGMKAAFGEMAGRVELGVGNALTKVKSTTDDSANSSSSFASIRLLYGTYKLDFGTVLIGQDFNNYYVGSAQVALDDNANKNYGATWDTRQPQIKLTFDNGIYLAAIQASPVAATTENFMPKLNIGYEGKNGDFKYGAGVVGQAYKDQSINPNNTITSLMGYFHSSLKVEDAALLINLGVGQNTGNMGFSSANGSGTSMTNIYYKKKNTTSFEGMLQASYTLSPKYKFNAGVGYAMDDNSNFIKTDNRMALFVNAPITLGKKFSLTPEFTYHDQLDQAVGTKGNKDYIYGAKWQMDF